MKIAESMEIISRTGYSNLPVYNGNKLIGVLNARKLLGVLGAKVGEGVNLQEYIDNTTVSEIIAQMGEDYYYILADDKLTIDAAMNYFENNRKLLIIIITKEGKDTSRPHCIITQADIIDMKKILDVY